MGGGASGIAMPPRTARNCCARRPTMAGAPLADPLRFANGLSDTIRNAAFGWLELSRKFRPTIEV